MRAIYGSKLNGHREGGAADLARQVGPSFRSQQLVRELRKLRMAAGLSQAQVAQAVGMSESKIGKQEKAKIGIYPKDLRKLLDLYGVTDQRRGELLDAARHAKERGALYVYGSRKLPVDLKTWLDFESEASAILIYQPLVIPGLLQTPEYARAIIHATGIDLSEAEIHGLVSNRMARQELLSRTSPIKLHTILEQSVLARHFGHDSDLVRQLHYLLETVDRGNITIQIIPTDAGLHTGLNGPFNMLTYDDKPSLIHLESKVSNLFLDEEEQIQAYKRTWDELCALAYSMEKSVDFISAIATRLGSKP
ncbi:MAG: helix-turn-helix domain-containing protein [Actinomycetota bacterium]|nr:helix-turn-helix domain-containing protein [Actinomycetota bacterium]